MEECKDEMARLIASLALFLASEVALRVSNGNVLLHLVRIMAFWMIVYFTLGVINSEEGQRAMILGKSRKAK